MLIVIIPTTTQKCSSVLTLYCSLLFTVISHLYGYDYSCHDNCYFDYNDYDYDYYNNI